jgi:hypothetical protein
MTADRNPAHAAKTASAEGKRERASLGRQASNARDVLTVVLLLVGILVFGIGWLVGIALLWSSPTWRLRDRLLGTLLVPGGLPFGVVSAGFGVTALFGFPGHPGVPVRVTGGALQIVLVLGPLYTAVDLARRL